MMESNVDTGASSATLSSTTTSMNDNDRVEDLQLKIKELSAKLENEKLKQNEIEKENKNLKKIINDLSPHRSFDDLKPISSNNNNNNNGSNSSSSSSNDGNHKQLEETITNFEDQVNQLKLYLTKRMPSGSVPVPPKHSLSMSHIPRPSNSSRNVNHHLDDEDHQKILHNKIGAFEQKFNSIKNILLDISTMNNSSNGIDTENDNSNSNNGSTTSLAVSKPIDIPNQNGQNSLSSSGGNVTSSEGTIASTGDESVNSSISTNGISPSSGCTDIIIDLSHTSSIGSPSSIDSNSQNHNDHHHHKHLHRSVKSKQKTQSAMIEEINLIDQEINEIRKHLEEQKEKERLESDSRSNSQINLMNENHNSNNNNVNRNETISIQMNNFPDVPSNFPIMNIDTISSSGGSFIGPTTINIAEIQKQSSREPIHSTPSEQSLNDSNESIEEESNVKVIALYNQDIIKEGLLKKKGGGEGGRRSWKTRWFKLKSDSFAYYKKSKDPKPQGIIHLSTAKVERHTGKPFGIVILSGVSVKGLTRDYLLMAESKKEQDDWVKILSETIEKLRPSSPISNSPFSSSMPTLSPNNSITKSLSQSTSNLLKSSTSMLTHPPSNVV